MNSAKTLLSLNTRMQLVKQIVLGNGLANRHLSTTANNEQHVVLITGSTSGIGLGIAERFATEGKRIVINGFGSTEVINDVKEKLRKLGAKNVMYHGADMSQVAEIEDMFSKVKRKFGRIDILVNNAGVQHVAPIEEFPNEKWEQIIRINLIAVFHTIKRSVPLMKAQGWGRIINIASAHGLVASPYKSAYVSAKHGLLGLTKTVALEVAQHNITCNAICPGYVKTPLVLNQVADTARVRGISEKDVINDVMLRNQPTKKFVEVSEISAACAYLASESTSSVTGTSISLDGGWIAQ